MISRPDHSGEVHSVYFELGLAYAGLLGPSMARKLAALQLRMLRDQFRRELAVRNELIDALKKGRMAWH